MLGPSIINEILFAVFSIIIKVNGCEYTGLPLRIIGRKASQIQTHTTTYIYTIANTLCIYIYICVCHWRKGVHTIKGGTNSKLPPIYYFHLLNRIVVLSSESM